MKIAGIGLLLAASCGTAVAQPGDRQYDAKRELAPISASATVDCDKNRSARECRGYTGRREGYVWNVTLRRYVKLQTERRAER